MKHHILMVSAVKQFMSLSIKEKLTAASYDVTLVPANMQLIHDVKKPIDGIIIYVDDEGAFWLSNNNVMMLLKGWSVMYNIPVFLIGYQADLRIIHKVFPKYLISYEFVRPIKVKMIEIIDRLVKCHKAQSKKKILVVDDSGAVLRTVKAWLDDKYHVFPVNSGMMAIKYLTSNRPDLILLDYEMPVCDGSQTLAMIRSDAEFADIPVMFLTNHGNSEYIQKVKNLKPQGYLLKSQAPALIIKAVNEFFEENTAE